MNKIVYITYKRQKIMVFNTLMFRKTPKVKLEQQQDNYNVK